MNDTEIFTFCDKIDIHTDDVENSIESAVAIAIEHGFRGISVPSGKLKSLSKMMGKDSQIKKISYVDCPNGMLSTDIRSYSILSAKENGASEIEIFAPNNAIINDDLTCIINDIETLHATAMKADIELRYAFDQKNNYSSVIITKICKILNQNEIKNILLYSIDNLDHSEKIMGMRNFKNKTNCNIKSFVNTSDVNNFALYPKAGSDIIGMNWKGSANIAHSYEELIIGQK